MAQINDYYGVELDVNVDFGCEIATPVIRCKQGDDYRVIKITPLEQGQKIITVNEDNYTLIDPANSSPTGSVKFRIQRPDGAVYEISIPNESYEGWFEWYTSEVPDKTYEKVLDYVAFSLSEDMLAIAGRALCDVCFEYDAGTRAATASFYLDIEPKPTAKASGGIDPASFVNVKQITAENYASITPDPHTLYIIIDGEEVTLAFGSAVLESGGGYNEIISNPAIVTVEEVTE